MKCPRCGAPVTSGIQFCSACGGTIAATMTGASEKKSSGAVIFAGLAIAGFFAVGLIGVIAAILIPNLLMAQQRGRQKRTQTDLRALAAALSRYQTDYNHYPAAQDIDGLCAALQNGLPVCPRADGWSTPERPHRFAYAAWGAPAGCAGDPADTQCGPQHYGLASAGKDGLFEFVRFTEYGSERTSNFNSDLVLLDGEFVRQPDGAQQDIDLAYSRREPPTAPVEPSAQTASGAPVDTFIIWEVNLNPPNAAQQWAQTQTQLAEMRSGLASYLDARREYPSPQDAEELCILLRSRGLHNCSPNDAWGHPLRYQSWKFTDRYSSTSWISAFVLVSAGPDGKPTQIDLREFLQSDGGHGDDLAVSGGYDPDPAGRHSARAPAPNSTQPPFSLPAY